MHPGGRIDECARRVADFEVQVRSGAIAGGTYRPDLLTGPHLLARTDRLRELVWRSAW